MCFSRFLREITSSRLIIGIYGINKVPVCHILGHKTLLCESLNYKHEDPGFYVGRGVYVDGFFTKRVRHRLNLRMVHVKYMAFQSK